MANISSYSGVDVAITEEEKKVLDKALDIIVKISKELWEEGGEPAEDLSYQYSLVAENLRGILRGDKNFA